MKPKSKKTDKSTSATDAKDSSEDAESETTSRGIVFAAVSKNPIGTETKEAVNIETKVANDTGKNESLIEVVSDKSDSNGPSIVGAASDANAEKAESLPESLPIKEDTGVVSSAATTEEEKVDVSALAKARSNKKVHHHVPPKNSAAAAALKEMKASQNGSKKKKKNKKK
jgi:hypothetical protein